MRLLSLATHRTVPARRDTGPRRGAAAATTVAAVLTLSLLSTACRVSLDADDVAAPPFGGQPVSELSDRAWCDLPGRGADDGVRRDAAARFESRLADDKAPSYRVHASINPESGAVEGRLLAQLPAEPRNQRFFRVFAGMDAFEAGLTIDNVQVNGDEATATLDTALLTVDVASEDRAVVELDFAYQVDQMAANESLLGSLTGETLQPDQVGLLGRTPTGMQLGHWFPVWLPTGSRTDPDPSGFGDIGAFPTAAICAELEVPDGYSVVTSGSDLGSSGTTTVQGAMALRDFAVLISSELAVLSERVDGVRVRVWGPRNDMDSIQTVLDHAVLSQQALTEAFGPYPWDEIDVVSAPLGGGVGGMEWPGMVWIERSMFAGGLPGLGGLGPIGEILGGDMQGGLGELFGDSALGDLFDNEAFGSMFDDMLGDENPLDGLLDGLGGEALATTLEWTVAHELGHEWFHAVVGNDSIASPAVDEPLAQFAACVAMQNIHPENWRDICEAQTIDQFAQYQALGIPDAAAEQPSDAFESALQYGAVIYAKAPGFYLEVADLIGWDELIAALRSFVDEHQFELVSTDTLRDHLIDEAGQDGDAVADLWDRWFRQARGAEDIEIPEGLGSGLGGLGGLGGDGDDPLSGLLEGLEGGELGDLLGGLLDGADVEGSDLSALLEELLGG